MDKIDLILAELSPLMGKDDAESVKRKKELFAWFKEHNTEENKAKVQLFFDKEMKEMAKGIEDLRKQIDAEKYKILPLSYIAKNYFGKSSSWLLQRINGYKVRGRTYSLTDEQKNIFNKAVKEVAEKISSVKLV